MTIIGFRVRCCVHLEAAALRPSYRARPPRRAPGSYLNRKRYFLTNGYYAQGVCHAEKFRVVVWDIDSTFKARRVASPGGAGTEDRGYRVNRTADQMVHLMRLHTGAAPVNRSDTQMAFTNYRPVRSMFAKNTGSDNQDRDWSVETMCFGEPEDGGPGSEACANRACGSGARWCHQRAGDDIKADLDWDAPWQQLPIRGTSDGTFRYVRGGVVVPGSKAHSLFLPPQEQLLAIGVLDRPLCARHYLWHRLHPRCAERRQLRPGWERTSGIREWRVKWWSRRIKRWRGPSEHIP